MEETFINVYKFQETILKYICSDEINKIVDSTVFKDDPNGKQAIIHGMGHGCIDYVEVHQIS